MNQLLHRQASRASIVMARRGFEGVRGNRSDVNLEVETYKVYHPSVVGNGNKPLSFEHDSTRMTTNQAHPTEKIWWSNIVVFVSVHIGAFLGVCWMPPTRVPHATLWMSFILWQLASFG